MHPLESTVDTGDTSARARVLAGQTKPFHRAWLDTAGSPKDHGYAFRGGACYGGMGIEAAQTPWALSFVVGSCMYQ